MAELVKIVGSLVALPQGGRGGASGEIDLGDAGRGDIFEDVRQREEWRVATSGPLGAQFAPFDVPATVAQLFVYSPTQSDVVLRFNGNPAIVIGTGGDPTAIIDGDTFTIAVDQHGATTVRFSDERTWDAVLARINGVVGQHVADRTDEGRIRFTGAKTGDETARERGWQHGSIELGGSAATLAKLGLVPGLTFGTGTDLVVRRRFLFEPPTNGPNSIRSIEISGAAELITHVAGY